MNKLVQITPKDLVAVALMPLKAGDTVDYGAGAVTLLQDIPMGHKVALRAIEKANRSSSTVSPSAKPGRISPKAPISIPITCIHC